MRAIAGESVITLAADIDPNAAGLYLVAPAQRAIVQRGDSAGFAASLLELCIREHVDVLIPTVDEELLPLARTREHFERAGVAMVLAGERTLEVCLDKWLLHQRCREVVRVPACWLADEIFDPGEPELPVIAKPRRGSGSRGVELLRTREQLERVPRDATLIVQEHLPGQEYSLDVLAGADGVVRAVVPRERLKVDSGVAVAGRTLHDEGLQSLALAVADAIELTTVANVQVKRAGDGTPALLEVNPRFPGTMPLTVAAGIDMPSLALAEALGDALPREPLRFTDVAMVRYLEGQVVPLAELADIELKALETERRAHGAGEMVSVAPLPGVAAGSAAP